MSLFTALLLLAVASGTARAKPLPAPTEEEACRSGFIVIAEYLGYRAEGEIGYFRGPIATYRVLRVLKGDHLPAVLDIHYQFHDGSADLAPAGWRFSDEIMPTPGSRWILFLNGSEESGVFTTYRGDFGRWEATVEQVERVEMILREPQVTAPEPGR